MTGIWLAMALEEQELELERLLVSSTKEDLTKLAQELGMLPNVCEGKSHLQCIKIMRKFLDDKESEEEQTKKDALEQMIKYLSEQAGVVANHAEEAKKLSEATAAEEKRQKNLEKEKLMSEMEELKSAMEEKLQAMESLGGGVESSTVADTGVVPRKARAKNGTIPRTYAPGHRASNGSGDSGDVDSSCLGAVGLDGSAAAASVGQERRLGDIFQNSTFRKEFKIHGMIGDSRQPKQTYTYLARQIEEGKQMGYSTQEIVTGVIKALTPGIPLRAYLESTTDIGTEDLLDLLWSHFQEKGASQQLRDLQNAVQGEEETAIEFVLRVSGARSRLMTAMHNDPDVTMDSEFIHNLFLRTLETGITDDRILAQIRPTLDDPDADERDLMKQVQRAMASLAERDSKTAEKKPQPSKKNVKVAMVDTKDSKERKDRDTSLFDAIGHLTKKMEKVESDLKTLSETKNPQPKAPRKCETCTKDKVSRCTHCWLCGEGSHKIQDCPRKE